jgi:hypothetical protein
VIHVRCTRRTRTRMPPLAEPLYSTGYVSLTLTRTYMHDAQAMYTAHITPDRDMQSVCFLDAHTLYTGTCRDAPCMQVTPYTCSCVKSLTIRWLHVYPYQPLAPCDQHMREMRIATKRLINRLSALHINMFLIFPTR